jgi:hypothetical protein
MGTSEGVRGRQYSPELISRFRSAVVKSAVRESVAMLRELCRGDPKLERMFDNQLQDIEELVTKFVSEIAVGVQGGKKITDSAGEALKEYPPEFRRVVALASLIAGTEFTLYWSLFGPDQEKPRDAQAGPERDGPAGQEAGSGTDASGGAGSDPEAGPRTYIFAGVGPDPDEIDNPEGGREHVTRRLDPDEMERRAKRLGLDRIPLEELEAIFRRALERTFSQVSAQTPTKSTTPKGGPTGRSRSG